MNALTLRETFPGITPQQSERIRAALAAAHAPGTLAGYASAFRQFCEWIQSEAGGISPLAATPQHVAAYLAHRAECRSVSSVRHSAAAIAHAFRSAGQSNPAENPGVRQTLRGIARQAAAAGRAGQKQAAALTSNALSAIRATARNPRTGPTGRTESAEQAERRGIQDIALAAVMRDGLLRRSEAAALQWGDIEFRDDDTARATLHRSKTDQAGAGAVLFLSRETAADLRNWRSIAPEGDSVFGLSGRSVSNRLRAAALAAGLQGEFSGHSPRVGMARDLSAAGIELPGLMQAGRWKSERMPALYTRHESAGRGAVARYYKQA